MYAEMLKNAVIKSHKTLNQISEECKKIGVSITKSYLSKLQNGKRNPPHEKVTFAIAQVLDVDPWQLIQCATTDNLENMPTEEGENDERTGNNERGTEKGYQGCTKEIKAIKAGRSRKVRV